MRAEATPAFAGTLAGSPCLCVGRRCDGLVTAALYHTTLQQLVLLS
jgi:hypothetical protein